MYSKTIRIIAISVLSGFLLTQTTYANTNLRQIRAEESARPIDWDSVGGPRMDFAQLSSVLVQKYEGYGHLDLLDGDSYPPPGKVMIFDGDRQEILDWRTEVAKQEAYSNPGPILKDFFADTLGAGVLDSLTFQGFINYQQGVAFVQVIREPQEDLVARAERVREFTQLRTALENAAGRVPEGLKRFWPRRLYKLLPEGEHVFLKDGADFDEWWHVISGIREGNSRNKVLVWDEQANLKYLPGLFDAIVQVAAVSPNKPLNYTEVKNEYNERYPDRRVHETWEKSLMERFLAYLESEKIREVAGDILNLDNLPETGSETASAQPARVVDADGAVAGSV